ASRTGCSEVVVVERPVSVHGLSALVRPALGRSSPCLRPRLLIRFTDGSMYAASCRLKQLEENALASERMTEGVTRCSRVARDLEHQLRVDRGSERADDLCLSRPGYPQENAEVEARPDYRRAKQDGLRLR